MTTKRSQNSVLLLATLGVYLGLVLAGATPQVLASAALSKQFNVRDEIEFRDDLDNKPDDERSPVTTSVQIYLEDVEYFLASLGRLQSKGRFDLTKDTFNVAQSTLLPCIDSNLAGRYTPVKFESSREDSRPAINWFSRGMTYGYSLGDCVANSEFKGVEAVDSRFDFQLDAKNFAVNVVVKKQSSQRAIDLQNELNSVLALYSTRDNSTLRKQIISNTTFKADNDQVFVVTRLPRGSLSSLLADVK